MQNHNTFMNEDSSPDYSINNNQLFDLTDKYIREDILQMFKILKDTVELTAKKYKMIWEPKWEKYRQKW